MKELNELVKLAKKATSSEWTTDARGSVVAVDDQANNGFVICAASGGDKLHNSAFISAANPETILAISEAFRALERRAEAAEAKLAELEKQDPAGYLVRTQNGALNFSVNKPRPRKGNSAAFKVFTRPAPAASLVELDNFALYMADESVKAGDYPDGWQCKASNAAHEYAESCRAAILRNIEKHK